MCILPILDYLSPIEEEEEGNAPEEAEAVAKEPVAEPEAISPSKVQNHAVNNRDHIYNIVGNRQSI